MRRTGLLLFSSICVLSGAALLLAGENDLPVVPNLDLQRYMGKWFEIARLPTSFQRKCESDVTATYTPKPDGRINVLNACKQKNGEISTAQATARVRDRNGPAAKLKVTFFWPFSGDYWVIDLDPEYKWAMVGTPNRKYLWILSRRPELPSDVYARLLAKAQSLGFDTSRVQKTRQSA